MNRARYRRIVFFFARILISFIFWDLIIARIGFRKVAVRTRPERLRKSARDFRILAIKMGGVLIKVGQFLSSRVDVLPPAFTAELEGLQDEVPPERFEDIRLVAEEEYCTSLEEKFVAFREAPLAAASLGQVHLARLDLPGLAGLPGEQSSTESFNVVVKIQRPFIETIIATDLAALKTVGKWLHKYRPIRRRADVPQLLDEFTRILYQEIDYLAEGRNAETFQAHFKNYPGVRVPKIIWSHTTRRVLTLENVLSIKVTDYSSIEQAGISRPEVASRLLNTYLKQIFEDGFFHADPHPGNLFIQPEAAGSGDGGPPDREPVGWKLTFVDFGMVGTVPPTLRQGLRELLMAVGTQDSARVVKAYQMMNVLLPDADLDSIERAGAKAFDRFWGKNMTELTAVKLDDIQDFVDEFRELVYTLPFQVPQNLIFLARAVGILSGMCTGLDPQFNLWDHLAPFARKLIAEEARNSLETWMTQIESLARAVFTLPQKAEKVLAKMERGEIAVQNPVLSRQVLRLEGAIHQLVRSILGAAFLLAGIQLLASGFVAVSVAFFTGSGLIFLWMLAVALRRNHSR